jgi:hypothetical protein
VVVIPTGRNKRGGSAIALRQIETKHITIELKRSFKVRHFEVDVPDGYFWVEFVIVHSEFLLI